QRRARAGPRRRLHRGVRGQRALRRVLRIRRARAGRRHRPRARRPDAGGGAGGRRAPGDDRAVGTGIVLAHMEIAHPGVTTAAGPPALLVSLHDVSPLTLELCEQALALVRASGLKTEELTVLVIPRHEGQLSVDQHPPTVRFLRALADGGARLVMHGLTHRMTGRALTPAGGRPAAHLAPG